MRELRASVSPGEVRVALLEDGRLVEACVERGPDGVGDLHRGRVVALAPAMAGSFVALVDGSTGFLPDSARPGPLSEGDAVLVRVVRASQGGKGPRLTAKVPQEAAAGPPALLARGPEATLRLAQAYPEALVTTDGADLAARLRGALGAARVRHARAFDDELEEAFAALAAPEVALPGGGRLLVHPTPALTAIDVDAGSAAGTRDKLAQARVNAAAIAEAARQIRARNLAGAILIDLAGLTVKQRAALEPELAAALKPDPLVRLLGIGPLGLFELQRQRVHPPLHEVLGLPASPLTEALAALRQAAREIAASPGARLALEAAPALLAALPAAALAELGTPLLLRPEPGRALGGWSIAHG